MDMRTYAALTVLAVLAASAATSAQVTKVTIGDGSVSVGTWSGGDEVPFQTALASPLLAQGGQIEVLPGTYTFASTVFVSQPGIRIHGAKGAMLRLADGSPGPILHVTGSDFVLEGLTLRAEHDEAAILIRARSEDPAVLGCTFEIASGGVGAAALELADIDDPPDEHTGALVQGNTFAFAADATGWRGLRVREYRATRILGNWFGSADAGVPAQVLAAINVHAGEWSTIEGNTFVELRAPATSDGDALVDCHRLPSGGEGEGGHIAVNGNTFDDVGGHAIVRIQSNGFNTIAGNVFEGPQAPGGAVRLLEGNVNVVQSNRFVNAAQTTHPTVSVLTGKSAIISSCTFLDCLGTQIVCADGPSEQFTSLTVSGCFFEANGSSPSPVFAMDVSAAVDVIIGGNTARSTSSFWDAQMFLGTAAIQFGNHVF